MGAGAFSNCSSLNSIEIPNSLTSIEGSEFYGCENLQYNMEGNLKYLGNSDNPYLYLIGTTSTDITFANINENCRFVGVGAFSNCSLLESIAIPNNVIIICDSAFYCCENLTSITIPNGMTSIGVRAFDYCSKLTSITIPNSVTSIGHLAFRGCTSLTIYCEAESQPSGWDERWNIYADVGTSTCPVVWGYKG